MKTIEERAKEYGSKKADISLSPIYNEALARFMKKPISQVQKSRIGLILTRPAIGLKQGMFSLMRVLMVLEKQWRNSDGRQDR